MAAKYLVADDSSHWHAVENIIHKLIKEAAVDIAECNDALMMEAACAVLIEPTVHVTCLVVASEEEPLGGV